MLRLVLVMYFTAIHENDPRTLEHSIGWMILAHWDLEHASNDPVLFDSLSIKYPEIACPLVAVIWSSGPNLITGKNIFVDDCVLERDKEADEGALKVTPKRLRRRLKCSRT